MENKELNFWNKENRSKYFVHVLSILCIISIIVFALLLIGNHALTKKPKEATTKAVDPFLDINLEAKGIVVWDVVNGREIFSKNSDLPLPLASLTKVMTAITADKNLPGSSNVQIKDEFLYPEGDSNLIAGDVWRASDLRDFTLVTSSNDGAFALASLAENEMAKDGPKNREEFIQSMNDTAGDIGLLNSNFFNEHGLDRPARLANDLPDMQSLRAGSVAGGAYGSAKDMAVLFEYALKNSPEILEATRYRNLHFASADKIYSADNTNIFIDKIPNVLASKTGYTDLAGGNLVVAYDAGLNRPIIISVLGSTQEGRFSDTLKLVEASLKYIQNDN